MVKRFLPIDATLRAKEPLRCCKLLAAMPVQREIKPAGRSRHLCD